MAEKYTKSLQENLITLLAYDDKSGAVVANMLDPNLMDGDYKTVVSSVLEYWKEFKSAPKDHLPDLLDKIVEDSKNKKAKPIRRILMNMQALQETMNTDFVVRQISMFHDTQNVKARILEAAELLNNEQHMGLGRVMEIFANLKQTQSVNFDEGTRGDDYSGLLDWMRNVDREFKMGIGALDSRHIRPQRGKLLIGLAPPGKGKSWWLVHTAATALEDRKKVLYLSFEMEEPEVKLRLYQRLFYASKRATKGKLNVTQFVVDGDGMLEELAETRLTESFALESKHAGDELQSRIMRYGGRYNNLLIKSFPSGSMTVPMIEAYIDSLEAESGWVPDMVLVDYLGIMKIDAKNVRASMNQNVVGLRGMLQRRNVAGVVAHQVSRQGAEASFVKATHVSEDFSIIMTADIVLTFSSSLQEFKRGLCRCFVAKGRSEADQFIILMIQSFAVGQFCIDSMPFPSKYDIIAKDFLGDDEDEADPEEGDAE